MKRIKKEIMPGIEINNADILKPTSNLEISRNINIS